MVSLGKKIPAVMPPSFCSLSLGPSSSRVFSWGYEGLMASALDSRLSSLGSGKADHHVLCLPPRFMGTSELIAGVNPYDGLASHPSGRGVEILQRYMLLKLG